MRIFVHPNCNLVRSTMGALLPFKRLLRFFMMLLALAGLYWVCSPSAKSERQVPTPTADRPPMFVLQVGIRKYKYAPVWAELKGAVNDVVEMRKVLEGERYKIPSANIVTLTDDEATKEAILKTFRAHLTAKTREHFEKTKNRDAVVMFQFSGHGSQAPDLDGDEKDDGKDETFVTVDSQDLPGKNFDITDDEIFALTSELRQWTDNIVYIFDSCHSGSGTRDSEDVRRLPERKTVPVPFPELATLTTRSGEKKNNDGESGVMPPGDDYIVITAARSNQLASQKNCFEECGSDRTPVVYGNLTFYLIDELKNARSDTSYRELMENVTRRVVAEKPTQTPQIEGDKSRFVFGSLGRTEDNFTRIMAAEKKPNGDQMVKIRAGGMQGVTVGTIVAFYDNTVTRFDQAEKVASGSVVSVTPGESTVRLKKPSREITLADKSVVVAPDLGATRLKVDLGFDAAKFTAKDKSFVTLVRSLLVPADTTARREVDVVKTAAGQPQRWDVALLKDRMSAVSGKLSPGSTKSHTCLAPTADNQNEHRAPAPGETYEVYYLAGRDFVPLFGFCMDASTRDERASAERLRKAIAHIAGIKVVNSISNKRSALSAQVTVTPVLLNGPISCEQSKLIVGEQGRAAAHLRTGIYRLPALQPLWFEVENRSSKPLYVAVLNVDPIGAVTLFSPRKTAEEEQGLVIPARSKRVVPGSDCRVRDGSIVEAGAIRASRYHGIDRYKFIFSTEKIAADDFAYLERPPIGGMRSGTASLAAADWTALETIFDVSDTGY